MFAYRKNRDICDFVYDTLIYEEVPEVIAHCVRNIFYNEIAELTTAIIIPDTDYLYGICDDNYAERDYKLITDVDVDEIIKQWDKGDGWEQWKTNRLLEVFADDGQKLYEYIKNCHYYTLITSLMTNRKTDLVRHSTIWNIAHFSTRNGEMKLLIPLLLKLKNMKKSKKRTWKQL